MNKSGRDEGEAGCSALSLARQHTVSYLTLFSDFAFLENIYLVPPISPISTETPKASTPHCSHTAEIIWRSVSDGFAMVLQVTMAAMLVEEVVCLRLYTGQSCSRMKKFRPHCASNFSGSLPLQCNPLPSAIAATRCETVTAAHIGTGAGPMFVLYNAALRGFPAWDVSHLYRFGAINTHLQATCNRVQRAETWTARQRASLP